MISPTWSSCRQYAGEQVVSNQVTSTLIRTLSKKRLFATHLKISTLHQRFIHIHLLQEYLTLTEPFLQPFTKNASRQLQRGAVWYLPPEWIYRCLIQVALLYCIIKITTYYFHLTAKCASLHNWAILFLHLALFVRDNHLRLNSCYKFQSLYKK